MNVPKVHNNTRARAFLAGYLSVQELCEDYPAIDDIFSGILELKTAGATSTRSLSRQVLFHILQQCRTIDVSSVKVATRLPYAYTTIAAYAALARVASKAIERFTATLSERKAALSLGRARKAIDAPYADELAVAVAASRKWRPDSIIPTYKKGSDGDSRSGLSLIRSFALAGLLQLTTQACR